MSNLIYILVALVGFILPFFSYIIINKKFKIISLSSLFYSYIFFLIGFFIFAKIFYIILELDINSLKLFFVSNNLIDRLQFIFFGYSFIGGYIGGIFLIFIFSKITKEDLKNLLVIYLHILIMMYGILKIACFINNCCTSYFNFPVQLLESIISIYIFFHILKQLNKLDKNKIIANCFIYFGFLRFLISIIRNHNNYFSFVFVELFCLFLIIVGYRCKNLK
ncbi:MAG: prolipoprotein diacylglyceryl transferase [Bacilli bacterium]|nr:prolipoprotein diacylglyceryl transferase [Bacilli bacterium]